MALVPGVSLLVTFMGICKPVVADAVSLSATGGDATVTVTVAALETAPTLFLTV